MKALVTTNHLTVFAGAALVAFEVAAALRDLGYRVDLCAGYISAPMEDQIKLAQLPYYDLETVPNIYEYDLVWAHHYIFPTLMASTPIAELHLPRIIAVSLSPYASLEMPGAIVDLAERVVANSQETADQLIKYGVNAEKIYVFDNATPTEFIASRPAIQSLKNILAVANHAPPELEASFDLLRKDGINVTRIGIPHAQERVSPELIRQHDAVITIGKTVQYSIQCETPPYIYDRFGGPGWLSLESASAASYYNFSGRCCRRKLDADSIKKEVISGHADASAKIVAIKKHFKSRFNLNIRLKEILERNVRAVQVDPKAAHCVRREGILAKELSQLYNYPPTINMLKAQMAALEKEIEARSSIIRDLCIEKFELNQRILKIQNEVKG